MRQMKHPFFHFGMCNPEEGRTKKNPDNSVPKVSGTNPSKDSEQLGMRPFVPTHNYSSGSGIRNP